MENKEIILQDIPTPIGSFILDQTDLPGVKGNDGTYWHYKDVCTMLDRAIKQDMSKYGYAASQPLYSLEQVKEIAGAFAERWFPGNAELIPEVWDEWSQISIEGKALLGRSEPVGVQEAIKEAKRQLVWEMIQENQDADEGPFSKQDIEADLYDWLKKIDEGAIPALEQIEKIGRVSVDTVLAKAKQYAEINKGLINSYSTLVMGYFSGFWEAIQGSLPAKKLETWITDEADNLYSGLNSAHWDRSKWHWIAGAKALLGKLTNNQSIDSNTKVLEQKSLANQPPWVVPQEEEDRFWADVHNRYYPTIVEPMTKERICDLRKEESLSRSVQQLQRNYEFAENLVRNQSEKLERLKEALKELRDGSYDVEEVRSDYINQLLEGA